jgi:hypothetical protein
MKKKITSPARAPLSDEELWYISPDQYFLLKLSDDERIRLREINKEKELERIDRSVRIRIEEEPVLSELREAGWNVQSVWDLVNTSTPYPEAIPVLLKHLQFPYSDVVKEGIARSLAVPEPAVQKAWPLLVNEYRKTREGWGLKSQGDTRAYILGAKDGLACVLAAAVNDDTLLELIALAKDPANGASRLLLLPAFEKRRKMDSVKRAMDELVNDPVLREAITSWGKR